MPETDKLETKKLGKLEARKRWRHCPRNGHPTGDKAALMTPSMQEGPTGT